MRRLLHWGAVMVMTATLATASNSSPSPPPKMEPIRVIVPLWHALPILLLSIDPPEDAGSRLITVLVDTWNGQIEAVGSRLLTVDTVIGNPTEIVGVGSRLVTVDSVVGNPTEITGVGSRLLTVQYDPFRNEDVGSRMISIDGTATLTVNVTYGDVVDQSFAPSNVAVEILTIDVTPVLKQQFNAALTSGSFTNPINTRQVVRVRVRGAETWLDRVGIADLRGGSATINITLKNGDVDDSGEIDAADIDMVIAAFGGDSPPEDVDRSGEVDAADIDIVIANFGNVDE